MVIRNVQPEQNVPYTPLPTLAEPCNAEKTERRQTTVTEEGTVYLSFFLGRSWLVWPHLRLRQLVARGGRRAWDPALATRTAAHRDQRLPYIALAADHLLAVELGGESLQRGLNDTTTQAEDEVESRLL